MTKYCYAIVSAAVTPSPISEQLRFILHTDALTIVVFLSRVWIKILHDKVENFPSPAGANKFLG